LTDANPPAQQESSVVSRGVLAHPSASEAEPGAAVPPAAWSEARPRGGCGRVAWLVALVFGAAVILSLGAYVLQQVPGRWFPDASTVAWGPPQLAVTRGRGAVEGNTLSITPADPSGIVVVSLNTALRAADYPVIAWQALRVPENAEVRLLWRTDYQPATMHARTLRLTSGRIDAVSLADDANWIGRVLGVALAVQGDFAQPMLVAGVAARPMGVGEVVADRWREWFAFERWSGRSINTIAGGSEMQALPLPVLLAVAIAVAVLGWLAIARWRGWMASLALAGGAFFVAAWLLSDVRWAVNLVRQNGATIAQYAGKDAHAKREAAEDGALFSFIERVRAKLPAAPARVFMAADAHYFRGRGAYHLYPHNVFFDPFANTIAPPERMKAGDYMVVYHRRGVQFDRGEGRLRWDGQAAVPAELVLLEPGAALFRIR
jgi:hypothetical protein